MLLAKIMQLQCLWISKRPPQRARFPHHIAGACWEFGSREAAAAFTEAVYLGLAVGRGLLPPPSDRVPLEGLLARHATEVGA